MSQELRAQIEAALESFAKLYIGVSMNDDAKAAFTVLGSAQDTTAITAGDIRRARKALALLRSLKDEPSEEEVHAGVIGMAKEDPVVMQMFSHEDAKALAKACLTAARTARQP